MPVGSSKLALLRAAIAAAEPLGVRVALGVPRLDAVLAGGLMRGTLHEVFAAPSHSAAATAFVAALTARLGGPVCWIRQDYAGLECGELAATGLVDLGLDPARLLLVRVPDAAGALKAAADALSTSALGAVVIELMGAPKLLDLVAYRRLALAAGESGVTAFLLRLAAQSAGIGGAETRWQIRAAMAARKDWGQPVWEVDLQRNRHGPAGHWTVMWSCDDGVFRPSDRGVVVPALADRSSQAAMAAAAAG
jgi:protein ImuA